MPVDEARERARPWMKKVGLAGFEARYPHQLSGGQKQRVALGRALYQNPQAILADEPVSSVDPARAENLVQLLNQISQEENITLVMSLHNLELAKAYFPRLIGLRNGKVEFDSAPEDLNENKFKELYTLSEREILDDGEC